ncbi:proline-rich receptor-like protein kinase PERK13 isoform X2 [Hippocampus comes]|uniref:proline-rich receptor-like protein kinase PERK13 isoform X2 n=1 Tax=Hippocampus comes TaxID=109280 RepID=UPI00094E015F|nr:PREDICTED: proline-rich receptor-like protein kinase PERK13 isoform X2 [Hippocampus comes]
MEETLRQEIEYKSQNEEDQGGIRGRLRDRELLKRKRAEAEEKETYQVESLGKRQKADQRRGAKRRGRPKKTDCTPESSFTQEVKVADPEAPAVEVLPQSVAVIPALGLDSLPTLGSGTLEPVSTWLPNPVLTPDPNVALVSPPSLVPPPIRVPPAPSEALSAAPDVFRPSSAAFPPAAQDLATISDQISAPDLAPPPIAVLPDLSAAPDQALARGSDLIQAPGPVPDLPTAPTTAQSSSPDSDLFTPPATDPPVSVQDLSTAPGLVPVSAPDVVLVSALSQAPVSSEVVGAPASAIQRVETLSTDSQDKENIDLVPIEDLGPDELKNDVPPTQDKKADEDVSEMPSNNEPE